MRHIFIVNKISGKGQAYNLISLITDIAQRNGLDYEIELTQFQGHAKEIAKKYHGSDICLYSVGGDGTLSEILNGMSNDVSLAVIPGGSGNDFFRMIGKKHNFSQIIIDSIDAPLKKVDIGISDNLRFLNTTSFGLDADINFKASNLIRNTFLNKEASYLISIITNVAFLHPKHLRINVDNKFIEGKYLLAACMNGRYYGNGILVSPTSNINDGIFELCLYEGAPRRHAYPFLNKFLKGEHCNYPGFSIIKGKHIVIDADEPLPCQSDGENYYATHLELKVQEKWLSLKVPPYLDIIN